MQQYLWVQFPKPIPTGDGLIDALPSPIARVSGTPVEFRLQMILDPAEGPMASQVGCMLDVFAEIARSGGAKAGMLTASYEDVETPSASETTNRR